MLTPGEIAGIRKTFGRLRWDSCTIRRRTTTNEGGAEVDVWIDLATDVDCRITHRGGGEAVGAGELGGRLLDETTHLLTLPAEQDITEDDRAIVGEVTYAVLRVWKRSIEFSRRAEVKEL